MNDKVMEKQLSKTYINPKQSEITDKLEELNKTNIKDWFDDFIATICSHRDMILTDTARKDVKQLYDKIIFGKREDLNFLGLKQNASSFIIDIVLDYLKEIFVNRKLEVQKINIDLSGFNKILLWIVTKDNDEKTEDALILAQARINAKFYKYGFSISSMIVEKSDNISIPPHYSKLFAHK